ncbi:MAG: hypothetical protein VX205_10315 [Pseudomonadota bacterium]|nr:hypothetical protein [Sphingobium naphthae]MEC8035373.1 hypothetical protein [Pseudomonadota bacterium]|tara:strand:- start:3824 stop:3985 length:162 start_codon:yes stop_codon:yes gene_type:complete
MEDHLKAAAEAADMSNDELMTTWAAVTDREILTNEQQAVMDEMIIRGLMSDET